MMQAAARIGVPPEAFWRLSLAEWRMLTAALASAAPMSRARFEKLAETWADE
jgi:uncharacterized phage protein (TIGR02216 family)